MSEPIDNPISDHPIIELNINDIKEDPTNPNVMTLEQSRGLEKSLLQFGRLKNIVVDQNNILIDGYHRWEIEKANGTQKVKVIQVHVIDEVERKLMRETLNRLHGDYDPKKESDELLSIFENDRLDELSILLAKPVNDLQDLIKEHHKDMDFPFDKPSLEDAESTDTIQTIINTITKPLVKKGDVWQLGNHIMICGDSTDENIVHKLKQNLHKVNLVFTDPPYNVNFKYNEYSNDDRSPENYKMFCKKWFYNVINIIEPDLLIFTPGPRNVSIYDNFMPFDDIGIWYKNNSRTGASFFYFRRCEPILFYGKLPQVDKKRTDDYFDYSMQNFKELNEIEKENDVGESHAPAKTLSLIIDIINNYTNKNDVVVDTFLGTGTTLIASEMTNRICYGIEMDEKYCTVILERFYQLTNKDPIRLNTKENYSVLKKSRYLEHNKTV